MSIILLIIIGTYTKIIPFDVKAYINLCDGYNKLPTPFKDLSQMTRMVNYFFRQKNHHI